MRPIAYLYPDLRKFLLLDGFWSFQEDPIDIGREESWFLPSNKHLFTRKIRVPSSWQAEFPDLEAYSGTAWYATEFELDPSVSFQRIILDFTAVDYSTEVWLNGHFCGNHQGGYSRFTFDITEKISVEGINSLVVRVHDPIKHPQIPHGKQGGQWYQESSGIWGSVYVEYIRENITLNDIVIRTLDNSGTIKIETQIKQLAGSMGTQEGAYKLRISASQISEEGKIFTLVDDAPVILTEKTHLKKYHFEAHIDGLNYWSPGDPFLYLVECLLYRIVDETTGEGKILDSISFEFGFRTISIREGKICVNGTPIFIRGVLDQAYYPHTIYVPPDEAYIQKEIQLMKELGVNLNRKHIKVEDPRYLALCDREGILYWEEMPNFMIPTFSAFHIFERELQNMVIRDRNHPCVIIWGIYNEEWGVFGLRFGLWHKRLRRGYQLVRQLDPTRLIVDNSGWAHVQTDINDYHLYHIPPGSLHTWTGQLRYIKENPHVNFSTAVSREKVQRLPMIISEYGTCGLPSLVNIKKAHHSEWPYWFRHNGRRSALPGFCFPAGIEARADRYLPANLASSLEELARIWQWHQFLSLKYLNEEMRKEDMDGYIVTELADIEWEFNGLLDFYRNPKVFHEYFKKVNDRSMVVVRLDRHVVRPGEQIRAKVTLSIFEPQHLSSLYLTWALVGEELPGTETTYEVPVEKFHPYDLHEFVIPIPDISTHSTNARVVVQVESGAETIVCENFEPIFIISPAASDQMHFPLTPTKLFLYDPGNHIPGVSHLAEILGCEISRLTGQDQLPRNETVIATKLDKIVRKWRAQGVKILVTTEFMEAPRGCKYLSRFGGIVSLDTPRMLLPGLRRPRGLHSLPASLKAISKGENWYGMMSLHLLDPVLFAPLHRSGPLFWEMATLWPEMELHLPYTHWKRFYLLGGIVYGWVNHIRGTVVEFEDPGRAKMIVSTLQLFQNPTHPLSPILIKNMISRL